MLLRIVLWKSCGKILISQFPMQKGTVSKYYYNALFFFIIDFKPWSRAIMPNVVTIGCCNIYESVCEFKRLIGSSVTIVLKQLFIVIGCFKWMHSLHKYKITIAFVYLTA